MRNYILLFFGCLLFHLAGTWSLPLIDRDEPRFAEAAREMRERGDLIVPYFNNQFRFDKPPLTYWFQVASYRVFGENDFAARFPTAIAAALVAVVLLAWGQQLADEKVGWWAAIIFTLSLQTFVHGKAAVADMWLVLFVTTAHWAGYELVFGKKTPNVKRPTSNVQWRWWWIFYVSVAFAFLAKGPIGWTPLLTVAIAQRFHR
jgi:4-amino-4-deoxy-L-arabinose transferase-like glycosyltransferase